MLRSTPMRITKWGECAVLCCIQLARTQGSGTVGTAQVASQLGLDLQYIHQVLHRLKKGGVVVSERGPRGGYRLAKDAHEISLRNILYAAEGDTFELICDHAPVFADPKSSQFCGPDSSCQLRHVWRELRSEIDIILENRKLSDLASSSLFKEELVQLSVHNA